MRAWLRVVRTDLAGDRPVDRSAQSINTYFVSVVISSFVNPERLFI